MTHTNSRQTKDTASGFNSANVSVKSKINFIRRKLKTEKQCRFIDIFEGLNLRPHIVAMFLGVLELIKDAEISVSKSGGEIIIGRNDNNEQ